MIIVDNPGRDSWEDLCLRNDSEAPEITEIVAGILADVIANGDEALIRLTKQFDGVTLASLSVPTAGATVPPELEEAILVASRNITAFHRAQKESVVEIETSPGIQCWRKSVGIERVGLYVPGGSAPLFSTVLMLGIPAQLAGCSEIVLFTPPQKDGSVHPAILFAANQAGITEVVPVGGAQAIAAMAYGTETIQPVDKIFGPGNQWVNEAKKLVSADSVAIDLPAGPTEVALLIDDTANLEFVAADILAQAEHDTISDVFVVAVGEVNERELTSRVADQLASLPRADIAQKVVERARIVNVSSVGDGIDLINLYAAEHLIIQMHHAEVIAERIVNAGSVFIGTWTPESLGDYASGTNHTLPTNGSARAFSGVSLDSFVRKITFQRASQAGLQGLGPHVSVMARAEELVGHARAVELRLGADPADLSRTGFVRRTTNETDISVLIDLDGSGRANCETGLGFFDHMLDQIARHSGMDLSVRCDGDLEVDEHHTIEDTAIALGEAFSKAIGNKKGIGRYGFTSPMDDALAQVALDLSGRSWLVWDVELKRERVGDVPTEMFSHFFKSFCDGAKANINISARGENEHHIVESIFKGFARALGMAIAPTGNPDILPSTKGSL
jgi:histidinol dehydrogenase